MGKPKKYSKKNTKIHISKSKSLRVISPLFFNIEHTFYYEIRKFSFFLHFVQDQNDFKPSQEEVKLLEDFIFNSRKFIRSNENNNNIVPILPIFAKAIFNIKELPILNIPIHQNIKDIILECKNQNCKISIAKIKEIYAAKYDKALSIKTIHRIMRNKLGLFFRKSILKPKFLDKLIYKKMTFLFIKCIIRAIRLNFNFVFIDESNFKLKNNNFRFWQTKNDALHYGNNDNSKKNFLFAVSTNEVIHYKFTSQNTNSNVFFTFFNETIEKLSDNNLYHTIFILDNLSSHCTKKIKNLIKKKSLKLIYTVPYESKYNPIELAFRSIKLYTYKKIYSNIKELVTDVEKIIKSNKFRNTLFKNYLETLEQYIIFIKNNIDLDLNSS